MTKPISKAGEYLTADIKTEYKNQKDSKNQDTRWWNLPDEELYQSVFTVTNAIENELTTWRFQCKMYRFFYGNPEAWFTPNTPLRGGSNGAQTQSRRVQINVIQSCIDTAASMIAKNQPKPQFMTLGQDSYKEQQKAKNLTKYIAGVFDTCGDNGKNIYGIMKKVFLDAALCGTGAIKFYIDEGKVKAEWVFTDELIIDNIEGMRETPCQIHRRKFIPRDTLKYQYPKLADKIDESAVQINYSNVNRINDVVEVIESWHLKSGKKATDGRHTICIDQATLLSEPYDKDYYPIVFFRWADRPLGFWGRGIAEELIGIQTRINELMKTIQVSQELIAVPIIFLENGSEVVPSHVAMNTVARIINYTGTEPSYRTPQAVSPELYQHLDWLIQQAYQITGVSQANASGTKPTEVKSGAAIREVADIASGRFELIGQDWEQCFIQASKVIVNITADLYKKDKKISVKVPGKKFLEEIPWSEIDLSVDDFKGQVFPISGLPSTPTGKIDQLMDYVQAGWIDKDFAMELSGMPDLDDYVNLETAPLQNIRKILGKIIDDGKYNPPTQNLNLQLAKQLVTLEINRASVDFVDDDKVALLQQWSDQVDDLITFTAPPPQPQQQPVQQDTPPQASQQVQGVSQGQQ